MNMNFLTIGDLVFYVSLMIIVLSMTGKVSTKCTSEYYPKSLIQCYRKFSNKTHFDECPGALLNDVCINQFLWTTGKDRWHPIIQKENVKRIRELLSNPPIQIGSVNGNRVRRAGHRRIRVEYRDLTHTERKRFHDALNGMKQNTTMTPNVYDALVAYHSGTISVSAHGGPNFLGWHRTYLYLFENALLYQDPQVIFPYWDCTMDFELQDLILQSYFFSEHFTGGSGSVLTGPFKDWGITRNGNTRYQVLVSKRNVEDILSRRFHKDLFTGGLRYSIEMFHNRIHKFIGGDLARLDTAPKDPIFFLLHNFIDYIWEKFRENQRHNQINSHDDYPYDENIYMQAHGSYERMEGFEESYLNIDGYSDYWTSEIYTFKDSPTCPSCNGSPWLECINNYCRAKHNQQRVIPVQRRRRSADNRKGKWEDSNKSSRSSSSENDDSYGSEDESTESDDGSSESGDGSSESGERCPRTNCPKYDQQVQNNFQLNGKANTADWNFMAIEVVYKRPPGLKFKTYKMRNGRPDISTDIFNEHINYNGSTTLQACRTSGSGFLKVFVTADGLSYEGNSIEYAIVDERLPVSTGYAYVPIKPPTLAEETVVLLTASDECGRLCHAVCRNSTSRSRFKPCSGVLRLSTPERTRLYSDSIAKEANYLLKSEDDQCSQTKAAGKKCIKFVCDSDAVYPWDRIVNR